MQMRHIFILFVRNHPKKEHLEVYLPSGENKTISLECIRVKIPDHAVTAEEAVIEYCQKLDLYLRKSRLEIITTNALNATVFTYFVTRPAELKYMRETAWTPLQRVLKGELTNNTVINPGLMQFLEALQKHLQS